MQYKGFRYVLRVAVVPRQFRVAVYFKEDEPVERTVTGSRRDAEVAAQNMIDKFLEPKADLTKQ